jgi:hypothetical protein
MTKRGLDETPLSRREIVNADDAMSPLQEAIHQAAADESSATGHYETGRHLLFFSREA